MIEIHYSFILLMNDTTKERDTPWKIKPPIGEDEEYHLSTRGSQCVKLHDLNGDVVGIPILIEIAYDNGYNGVPIMKGMNR
jgi:hypothetical protein